jgi:hypothetical protein
MKNLLLDYIENMNQSMNIKDLLTPEQYEEQVKEYEKRVKNNEITFVQFLTKTYKLKSK